MDWLCKYQWRLQGWPRPFALKLEKVTSNWVLRPAVLYQVASFWKVHIFWMTGDFDLWFLTKEGNFWEGILHPINFHKFNLQWKILQIVLRKFNKDFSIVTLYIIHIRNNSIQKIIYLPNDIDNRLAIPLQK